MSVQFVQEADLQDVLLALSIAGITLGSCVACYLIGREAGRIERKDK